MRLLPAVSVVLTLIFIGLGVDLARFRRGDRWFEWPWDYLSPSNYEPQGRGRLPLFMVTGLLAMLCWAVVLLG